VTYPGNATIEFLLRTTYDDRLNVPFMILSVGVAVPVAEACVLMRENIVTKASHRRSVLMQFAFGATLRELAEPVV
jgi:hypothetical protein